jgi:hypothetical protein
MVSFFIPQALRRNDPSITNPREDASVVLNRHFKSILTPLCADNSMARYPLHPPKTFQIYCLHRNKPSEIVQKSQRSPSFSLLYSSNSLNIRRNRRQKRYRERHGIPRIGDYRGIGSIDLDGEEVSCERAP